jgi:branched-subunit amino acid transport protein AzlD
MKKTASQKIAGVFEIAGYLWLTPSVISLLYPLLALIGCIVTASVTGVLFLAIPFLIFGAGVFLLVQYYRHSRGLLGEGKINALWVGTLVFNLLFLLPSAYGFYSIPKARYHNGGQEIFIVVWSALILWWSAAVLMSITALMSRFRRQKYR